MFQETQVPDNSPVSFSCFILCTTLILSSFLGCTEYLDFMTCGDIERTRSCPLVRIPSGFISSSFKIKFNICAWTLLRIVHNTNRILHWTVSGETGSAHIYPAVCCDSSTDIKLNKINPVHSRSLLLSPALLFCHTSSSAASAAPTETWCC